MTLRLEPYDRATHYDLIASWWRGHGAQCLPADVLPLKGSIVTRDGDPIAACFVYLMNGCRAAYLAFPVTAPDLSPRIRLAALEAALEDAVRIAHKAGCLMIWSSTENKTLDRVLTRRVGFQRTTPHYNYFLLLDPALSHDMLVGEDFDQEKG